MAEVLAESDFGHYRIVRPLGRGGMGEVYLAEDSALDRKVAIKVIASDKLPTNESRRQLLAEARAAAGLDHPGICTVYDTGETPDGRAFIVMKYLEGQTMSALLEKGSMPVRDALALCIEIAEALSAAHHHGIVHRDLKPGNVIVTPSGHATLVDFGIARSFLKSGGTPDATTVSRETSPGVIVGTPGYMSPEELQQRPVDGRSDLFSLGAVLFECLTGRRAFDGPSSFEIMANVLHLYPPAASTYNHDLTDRHDELCRRLMAKDPADRFQSADEVVGAIRLLLPDTSKGAIQDVVPAPRRRVRSRRLTFVAVCLIGIVAAAGIWRWNSASPLPPVPRDADLWYQRGTDAIREGAYESGRRALQQAVRLFPQHVLAYARLAEADAELEDARAAQADLLRVSSLVSDESRLPLLERLRLQAVRALVLRDVDAAIALYKQLVALHPEEPGSWLDLGRAQESAGLRTDARNSYEHAIERSNQSAPAYLRLAVVEGRDSRRDQALAAFREAERLYRAASDVEGETEVLLRRGDMFNALGDLKHSRIDLERALSLATNAGAVAQRVRARLALSSVTASEGNFSESERAASEAVQEAVTNGLDIVAADGLVDLSATLQDSGRLGEAEARAQRAIELADQHNARRSGGRARVQLAAVYQMAGRPGDALTLVDGVLPFLKANQDRRLELNALSVASRAHEELDHLERARQISTDVLSVAEVVKDESQVAVAAANLASVSASLGQLPAALALRERAEAIHRRQGYGGLLPYDLANRGDVLIRLGRRDEADKPLSELEAGIAAGLESYAGRARRASFLRAMADTMSQHCDEALRRFDRLESPTVRDTAALLSPAMAAYCRARASRSALSTRPAFEGADPALVRERHYWIAAAALLRKDAAGALVEARQGLSSLGTTPNDELRWRLAAVGALAADRLGDSSMRKELAATSKRAWERIRSEWGADVGSYDKREDLLQLRSQVEGIWNP